MDTLPTQFSAAASNVTISNDKEQRAIDAHTEVRELLEADATLKSWGITPLLIGSYGRQTARYPGKDVDIFLRLLNLDATSDPAVIYGAVARVLIAEYGHIDDGGRVTPQARSLKVDFASPNAQADLAFSVDAVPAVPWGNDWAIPNRDRSTWENEADRWVRTNPIAFGEASQALSTSDKSPVVNGRNAYKPVVRLLRQVRHVHLGEAKPGGLYVEVAAFEAWQSGRLSGDSWAELLASSLYEVSRVFLTAASDGLLDPILRTPLKTALETSDWLHASRTFGTLAADAQEALRATPCAAAKTCRTILGTNDRGQVFPLPDGDGDTAKCGRTATNHRRRISAPALAQSVGPGKRAQFVPLNVEKHQLSCVHLRGSGTRYPLVCLLRANAFHKRRRDFLELRLADAQL